MNGNATTPKTGLRQFGFIPNMDYKLSELSSLCEGHPSFEMTDVDALVENVSPILLNSKGWDNFFNAPIDPKRAVYKLVPTGMKTDKGDEIYGFFVLDKSFKSFRGVVWGTRKGLDRRINLAGKFRIGEICFDTEEDGNDFLNTVAERAIPEPWSFRNEKSTVSAPILRSYLENIMIKLRKEAAVGASDKLIYNADHKKVMFNTNLLDIFSRDIIVIADVRTLENGDEYFIRPVLSNGSLAQLKAGFAKGDNPAPAEFFQDVRDVVFQTNWTVDENFDSYRHIIEQRIYRFPEEYQNKPTDELARKLKDAIDFAITLTRRNYKFVVPMYRPQIDAIQLLMPIYLSGSFKNAPDFALVLTPNPVHEIYEPETILPLHAVYQNARLIAKPDETWLNPDVILEDGKASRDEE